MNFSEVKCIFLDMDGTLCDMNGQVPEEFFSLIGKLNKKGIQIGIATGRNKPLIERIFQDYLDEMVLITANGTILIDRGEVFENHSLPDEVARQIVETLVKVEEINCNILCAEKAYTTQSEDTVIFRLMNRLKMNIQPIKSFDEVEYPVSNIGVRCPSYLHVEDYLDLDSLNCQVMTSGFENLDILQKGASKAHGIESFAKRLGISTDQMMAFGDQGNDIEMLKAVKYSVAMKNATEEVKTASNFETELTNAEQGAIEFIKKAFDIK